MSKLNNRILKDLPTWLLNESDASVNALMLNDFGFHARIVETSAVDLTVRESNWITRIMSTAEEYSKEKITGSLWAIKLRINNDDSFNVWLIRKGTRLYVALSAYLFNDGVLYDIERHGYRTTVVKRKEKIYKPVKR